MCFASYFTPTLGCVSQGLFFLFSHKKNKNKIFSQIDLCDHNFLLIWEKSEIRKSLSPSFIFYPLTKLNRKTNIEETDIEQSRKYYNFEVPLLIYSSTDLRHIVTVPRRICKLNMHGLLSSKMIAVTPANITVSFSSRDKAFLLDFRQNTGKRNTQKY